MPQPTPSDLHVSAALTNVSVAYLQDQQDYQAHRIFPIVPVQHQSNQYPIYNKEDFLRDEAKPRAPGTESAGGGWTVTTATYYAQVEAFHKDIDDQLRANADPIYNLDRDATQFVTQKMLTRRERRWISTFFQPGVWATDFTPSPLWSAASSTPQKDVETAKLAIQAQTGKKPNKFVLGPQVLSALRTNSEVRDQFKYTSADSITTAMLAGFFDVEQIIALNAVYTSSVEGNATQTTAFMAGKHALLLHAPDAASLLQPSAGYLFSWSGYTGMVDGIRVKRFRMEPIASERIEAEIAYDMKVVSPLLGYFFNGAVV